MALCLVYCLIAPKEFESTGKVELRGAPDSPATDRREAAPLASSSGGQVQLETLANVLRSERLAWDVVTAFKLYRQRGFSRRSEQYPADFNPDGMTSGEKDYVLRRFRESLTVESLPHTLVLAVRFRSHDPVLSASVVNQLIAAYLREETASRVQTTQAQTEWLNARLQEMKAQIDRDDARLADFQKANGILGLSEMNAGGRSAEVSAIGATTAIDTLSHEVANATAERLLREAEYKASVAGDPELVIASGQRDSFSASPERALLQQARARRSELELERAQLEVEHGPNYPRLAEIRQQISEADLQIKNAKERLVESFRTAWKTSAHREELVRKSLDDAAEAGLKVSGAALTYLTMREEASANREAYVRIKQQSEEASLAAGSRGSAVSVIDYARAPSKPSSPNLILDMAITMFVALWVSLSAALAREAVRKKTVGVSVLAAIALLSHSASHSQAPTPSTSGLPTGVARIPQSTEVKSIPSPKDAPKVWNGGIALDGAQGIQPRLAAEQMVSDAPIVTGDMLEVREAHAAEMHATVRVSQEGTVVLPLAGEVKVSGLDERGAAHAIENALTEKGMLLHPQVTVLVIAYAGQDISVLGEVVRPGVYGYAVHHRLLDLISAASGLSQNAGRLVSITHRNEQEKPQVVVLDPAGAEGERNPELLPGDTVQVGRAGLVYVVGDVIRPGGFAVDQTQAMTVVQALSLAWGPSQNAALKKAVLIREQAGGRTITTLNLKRMLRGLDPDLPVRDRDILFVPDSMAKNLLNRSMESVIQSAAGVSIYSGLVYSQRF